MGLSGEGGGSSAGKESPLADEAAALCLALAYHRGDGRDVFRRAMRACVDASQTDKREERRGGHATRRSADAETSSSASTLAGVDFKRLFESLGARAGEDDRAVGVLYAAMQHTPGFREYCLARGDPEVLVLPLLRRVYRRAGGSAGGRGFGSGEREARRGGVGSDPDASLVALCVLLMLSEEPSLARRIHAAPARDAPWYRERQLRDTTVGSLAVATLARAAKASSPTTSPDDAYASIIALSTLANLAPEFDRVSAHAAQRFVSLVDCLARRHARAKAALEDGKGEDGNGDDGKGDRTGRARTGRARTGMETTVTETPVTETPVTKTPVTKTPVTKTPVTKTPVTKTPVVCRRRLARTPIFIASPWTRSTSR